METLPERKNQIKTRPSQKHSIHGWPVTFTGRRTDGKTNPFQPCLACREPLINYSFNITSEFGVGILTGIATSNGINTANNDKNFKSDDFKIFYGRINFSYLNQGIGVYGYLDREWIPQTSQINIFFIGPDFHFTLFDDWNLWNTTCKKKMITKFFYQRKLLLYSEVVLQSDP